MIIAGWILAILGLAQVVFAGTIEVSQLTEGNRLIGLAPSVVANVDLVGQRAMIHTGGCATFLAGVVFIGAAYLKPAPPGQQSKAWTGIAAIAMCAALRSTPCRKKRPTGRRPLWPRARTVPALRCLACGCRTSRTMSPRPWWP